MHGNEHVSFCRICNSACGVRIAVDDAGHIASIRGDSLSPLSNGYACFKGLQAEQAHHGDARRLHPLRRRADGSFERIELEQALSEIAEKLGSIIATTGPRSVALFAGNGALFNSTFMGIGRPFLSAIGSDQYFTTVTIDQSAKLVSLGRMGGWTAGFSRFEDMDVVLLFGANPLLTHAAVGLLTTDPVRRMKAAKARGMKLIVIDPRRTETARHADLVLQPYPGEDAAIAGGLIRMILDENWHDHAFCAEHLGEDALDRLRTAVDPLTAQVVEQRAGLADGQLRAVAEMFARDGRKGVAYSATGPNMSPFSNLAVHLIDALNVICGRFLRAGEKVHSCDGMMPLGPVHAEVYPPQRPWDEAGPSRIRGAASFFGERLSATLSDEILTPGKDRIRSLFVVGGDPMSSLPDHGKAAAAMADLELLVVIDPWPSTTSRQAHYILPPKMQYERADLVLSLPPFTIFPSPWIQYTPPILPAPPGAELVDDWYVFWRIAQQLGTPITYSDKQQLDLTVPPTADDLLDIRLRGSRTTLDQAKNNRHGYNLPLDDMTVQPRGNGGGKFDLLPGDVAAELRAYLSAGGSGPAGQPGADFTHRLTTRRMRDFFNSNGVHVASVRARTPFNPAFMNPLDLELLAIPAGSTVELISAHGRTSAIVAVDPDVRQGVVSIAHGWGGGASENDDPTVNGSAVNRLIDTDRNFESINAMPHMSAVPIRIRKIASRAADDRRALASLAEERS